MCTLQTCRPKLSDEQKAQLRTCFDLMDADGSGAIDAEELSEAFELLGMNYTRAEIQVTALCISSETVIFGSPKCNLGWHCTLSCRNCWTM